jgi:hypothetical protein
MKESEEETTTIRLKKSTKILLDKFGTKPESYDDILLRLLKGGENERGRN